MDKSVFQQCALASGLLTEEQIGEAIAEVRAEKRLGQHKHVRGDELLAHKLVEIGRLNKWQAEQLRAGRTKFNLGPYQIIDSIGQGGMGQVFKAEHTIMGRVVAVKVLPRSRSTPDAILNFSREIRAQAQLDHENLVRAYDAGHDGNVYFLVTEYVPGTDLRRLIRGHGLLAMNMAASIMSQAARGLEHAHDRGLIHRDVKPGNLLVTPEGRTKVSDLGLAGFFKDDEHLDLFGGKTVGTADYLAPEQIISPGKLTPLCDVYALGCTLYYAVTGKVPFPGGTTQEKARAHCKITPLDPRRLNPELSDDFVDVIAEMMAKRVEERVQSAGEVITRLAPWVNSFLPKAAQELTPTIPVPPPIMIPPLARAVASVMSDTEPFLAQPAEEHSLHESPSQVSIGTQPFGVASSETLPSFHPHEVEPLLAPVGWRATWPLRQWRSLSQTARFWTAIAAAGATGAAIAVASRAVL